MLTKRSPAQVLAALHDVVGISVFAGTAGRIFRFLDIVLTSTVTAAAGIAVGWKDLVPTRPFEVSLGASHVAVSPRHAARMTGSVMPSAPGKVVELQLRARGRAASRFHGQAQAFRLLRDSTGAAGISYEL